MNTIESLLGMILEDAIERAGEPENHHFDETQNRKYSPVIPICKKKDSDVPSAQYDI